MSDIEFIFFDVGNVIFIDDVAVAFYSWRLFEDIRSRVDKDLTFERFLEERESFALGDTGDSATASERVGEEYLGKEGLNLFRRRYRADALPRYDELTPLLPGARELLESLPSEVPLGLIANQPLECARSLRRRGLWGLFTVHGISDEVGLYKPDPEFFRWACRQAGKAPDRCLMVGDRWENDVLAAKGVGMATVWLRWRSVYDKGIHPSHDYERLYFESVNRVYTNTHPWPRGPINSDHVVHSMAELTALLHRLVQT